MYLNATHFGAHSGRRRQRDEGQMRLLVQVGVRLDGGLKIPLRLQELERVLDQVIDGRGAVFFPVRQAKVSGKGALQQIFRFQPDRTEVEVLTDPKRQSGSAAGNIAGWIGIHLDVAVVGRIVQGLNGGADVFGREDVSNVEGNRL